MTKTVFLTIICSFIFLLSCKKDKDTAPAESILYQTDFSQDDGKWWTGSNNGITCSIQNGYYIFKNIQNSGIYFISLDPVFSGINTTTAFEASIKVTGTTGDEAGVGGLIWNRNSQNNYDFEFMINSIGKFRIIGYPDGSTFTLYKDWAIHSAVRSNDFNVLRVELRNSKLYFFINGIEVYSMNPINDNSLDRCGFVTLNRSVLQADYFKAFKSN